MSALTSYAALLATESGRAQRLTTVRHTHLSERPFVLIPLKLAGEACAPIAALAGADRHTPQLLVVPNPKDRTQRFEFTADLAELLLPYIQDCRATTETYTVGRGAGQELRARCTDAPQLVVPNPAAAGFLRLLGRSTRLRRTDGPFAVNPAVPQLGKWVTWFADRSEFPDSSVLLSLTQQLRAHWTTGQSGTEDGNLAALIGWIDPQDAEDGYAAALRAEDPALCPPAGPTTDPIFDRTLSELYIRYSESLTATHRNAVVRQLEYQLGTQLEPTWELVWRGIDLLRTLPPGGHVPDRWTTDRTLFTGYAEYLDDGGLPQARRDHASGAARRLAWLEEAATRYEYQRAFDDPLVMAEYELAGDALTGRVVHREADRMVQGPKQMVFRPLITLRTEPLPEGHQPDVHVGQKLTSPNRPKQKGEVLAVRDLADGSQEMELQLNSDLGSRRPPAPVGAIPELGELLSYTALAADGSFARMPDEQDTPWTHGGPPALYEPTDDDADEAWE